MSGTATSKGRKRGTWELITRSLHAVATAKTRFLTSVPTRERDKLVRSRDTSARTANLDLCACWVELSGGVVGGDELVPHQIVAGLEVLGNCDDVGLTSRDVGLEPPASILEALLVDLKPLSLARIKVGAGATTVGHVGHHWTDDMRPLKKKASQTM